LDLIGDEELREGGRKVYKLTIAKDVLLGRTLCTLAWGLCFYICIYIEL